MNTNSYFFEHEFHEFHECCFLEHEFLFFWTRISRISRMLLSWTRILIFLNTNFTNFTNVAFLNTNSYFFWTRISRISRMLLFLNTNSYWLIRYLKLWLISPTDSTEDTDFLHDDFMKNISTQILLLASLQKLHRDYLCKSV